MGSTWSLVQGARAGKKKAAPNGRPFISGMEAEFRRFAKSNASSCGMP